jgi:hypothetical protein
MYKPFHLIGLELSISVLNVALRGEPTGSCRAWRGDAVAVAKRASGSRPAKCSTARAAIRVYAKLIPAARSLALGACGHCRSGLRITSSSIRATFEAARRKSFRDAAAICRLLDADEGTDNIAYGLISRRPAGELHRRAKGALYCLRGTSILTPGRIISDPAVYQ